MGTQRLKEPWKWATLKLPGWKNPVKVLEPMQAFFFCCLLLFYLRRKRKGTISLVDVEPRGGLVKHILRRESGERDEEKQQKTEFHNCVIDSLTTPWWEDKLTPMLSQANSKSTIVNDKVYSGTGGSMKRVGWGRGLQ